MKLLYRRQQAVSQSDCLTKVYNNRKKDRENMNMLNNTQEKFHPKKQTLHNFILFH